jgi:hypothetical protein
MGMSAFFPDGLQRSLWTAMKSRGYETFHQDYRMREAYKHVPTYLSRIASPVELPKVSIDIDFMGMQRLQEKRLEALEKGLLETGDDDYVSGFIRTNGKRVKVRMRLKGDRLDHLSGDKWSFRTHVSGDDHLWGMRSFSIQHPKTRGFHAEVLFHETLRQFGVITPRYFFIDVSVNGKNIGIMAVEEFFAKELLEYNGRKDSVILKFDEFYRWNSRDMANFRQDQVYVGPFESHINADIQAFQSSRVRKSDTLQADFRVAVGLLRGFSRGILSASEVFDIDLMASYLAVSEFWGAKHEIHWTNLRFYYNPISGRLEPVPFDGNIHNPAEPNTSIVREKFAMQLLEDPKIFAVFRRRYESLVQSWKSGELPEMLRKLEQTMLADLQSEFYFLDPFSDVRFEQRIEQMPRELRPFVLMHNKPIFARALIVTDGDERYLELMNPLTYEVEVLDAYWINEAGESISFESTQEIEFPIALAPTPLDTIAKQVRIPYKEPKSDEVLQLKLRTSVTGYEDEREVIAQIGYPALSSRPFPSSSLAEQLERHPFLSVDESERAVLFEPGEWDVDGDILLPEGYEARVSGGTTLRFDKGAVFVINGIATFAGTAGQEIVLQGKSLSDGSQGSWQGMAIYNAPQRSHWSHVVVRNTTGIRRDAWRLTGGVTFYKSDVDMVESRFEDVMGEDGLNIVHSDFELTDIAINNTVSDGFDADFTTGVINRGLFSDIGTAGGGDAVDFSGSDVEIIGSRFEAIRDKAISVGESSRLKIRSVDIDGGGVGIASKDNSSVTIEDSRVRNVQFAGLMAYMKKPEYGPATMVATNMEFENTSTPARMQIGSKLTVNGESIPGEAINVDALYETVMKPGIEK